MLFRSDIDYFKHVNDTFGHDAGDVVLKEVASILEGAVADIPGAHTGRWGGEEFFVLLPDTEEKAAYVFAENLRRRVDGHVFPEVKHLTISLGVISALGMEDRKSIYTNVDNALYQAKDSGRNCIVQCRN